jgi:RNA polymerase sigma-70 factor (ECF subfamily)
VNDARMGTELERVYREHGERLWRAVFAYAADRSIADDAVAEAFTQALRRGPGIGDPLRWVWRVAFRVAAGELQERRKRAVFRDETVHNDEVPVDLMRALARLSPKQRAAILLHHYAGYRTSEIADILGSTTGAVRVHLSVGRRRLRDYISEGIQEGIQDA